MNLELAKKKLDKINRLIETFEPGENHVSRLEKDLIMSYTREFYDAISEPINGILKTPHIDTKTTTGAPKAPKKVVVQAEHDRIPEPKQEIKEEVIIQQYTEPERDTEKNITQVIAEEASTIEAEVEQTAPSSPSQSKIQEQVGKQEVVASSKEAENISVNEDTSAASSASVGRSTTNPELLELFAIKKANEISEKLSQLPISDLNKAMGVNEKIFVKNELFGGDDNVFRSTLSKLNTFQNFDEAKDYLATEVANSFEWTAPDKSKKAKNFIQLVYRRYK